MTAIDQRDAGLSRTFSGRSVLSWLDKKIEFWLTYVFYMYLFLVLTAEVVCRFVFDHSFTWSVETSLYAFIWLTYLSVADMARNREHLAFTMVRDWLNRHGQFVCLAVSDIALAAVSVTIIFYIWEPFRQSVAFKQEMTGIDFPIWPALIAVPVGWALVLVRVVQRFLLLVENYRKGKPLIAQTEAAFDAG